MSDTEVERFLNGFDYIAYLHRHMMLGQLDPWRKTDEGKSLYALLVPLNFALEECKYWSKQEIGETEFKNYLKTNDIWALKSSDEISKIQESRRDNKDLLPLSKRRKRRKKLSPEQRQILQERAKSWNQKKLTDEIPSVS